MTRPIALLALVLLAACDETTTAPEQRASASGSMAGLTTNTTNFTIGSDPGEFLSLSGAGIAFMQSGAGMATDWGSIIQSNNNRSIEVQGKDDASVRAILGSLNLRGKGATLEGDTAVKIKAGGATIATFRADSLAPSDVELNGGVLVKGRASVGGAYYTSLEVEQGAVRFGGNEFTPQAALFDQQTAMIIVFRDGSAYPSRRVTVGAANSGGPGRRMLTIAN